MTFEESSRFGAGLQQRVSAELAVAFERAGLPGRTAPVGSRSLAAKPEFARRSNRGLAISVAAVAVLGAVGVGAIIMRAKPPSAVTVAPSAPPALPRTATPGGLPPASATPVPAPAPAQASAAASVSAAGPHHKAGAPAAHARVHALGSRPYTGVKAPLCPRGEGCRAAVLDADRRLREAYAGAVRAGVSGKVLAAYRDRWAERREQAASRPASLVKSYGLLTQELRQEADEARGEYRPAAHRSTAGLKAAAR